MTTTTEKLCERPVASVTTTVMSCGWSTLPGVQVVEKEPLFVYSTAGWVPEASIVAVKPEISSAELIAAELGYPKREPVGLGHVVKTPEYCC